MKVAVPHAIERDYVLEPRVLVATLKEPVAFKEMGDGDKRRYGRYCIPSCCLRFQRPAYYSAEDRRTVLRKRCNG